jgi:hypothetical protein
MIVLKIKDGNITPSGLEHVANEQIDWFELRNGGYIGVNSTGLIYGLRDERTQDSIDEELRHESAIRMDNYPDGFEMQFNTRASWARIQKNKYRFSTETVAESFKEKVLATFPLSLEGEKTKNTFVVVHEPLIALVILFILLMTILSLDPARDNARSSFVAFLLTLSRIPDSILITAYSALSGLALFYLWYLQKEHKQTDFKRILPND